MPNAAQRNAAQKKTSAKAADRTNGKSTAEKLGIRTTQDVVTDVKPVDTTPKAVAEVKGNARPTSIRQRIMGLLTEGKTTAEITPIVQAEFPGSKAAEKPTIHINFYRSRMKKDAAAAKAKAEAPAASQTSNS